MTLPPTKRGDPRKETDSNSNQHSKDRSTIDHGNKPFFTRQVQADDTARQLLHSWAEHGRWTANDLPIEAFPGPTFQQIAQRIAPATEGRGQGWANLIPLFTEEHLRSAFIECTDGGFAAEPDKCGPLIDRLREFYAENQERIIADRIRQAIDQGGEIAGLLDELTKLKAEAGSTGIAEILKTRAFDFDSPPPKPFPIFMLATLPLCTAGNITNIQALPKAGKSAVIECLIASAFNGNHQGPDMLGFSAENPQGHAFLHFDTEQSRYDADALIRRACRRAHLERPPTWFRSYAVADLDIGDCRLGLRHAMAAAMQTHGGIFAVCIDGVADLCADPNDAEEAFDLVHELHALAITHDCTFVTVLHENPGSDSGKTRGHLGSQLERKAETNLRLAKDKDGITTIWAERARHFYLPKEKGLCFSWSDAARMHLSCGTSGEIKSAANRERLQTDAATAFGDAESFRHADLLKVVCAAFDLKERAAKERVRKWAIEGVIKKDEHGKYRLSNP